ncbi:putative extensin [Iris pallida]|uniref:Extensin n=1 Tax=Iris pallida TaxID=29817 RepID=A0AAX6EWR1_IRIPA|nr:putative extensin [Iris pallida]
MRTHHHHIRHLHNHHHLFHHPRPSRDRHLVVGSPLPPRCSPWSTQRRHSSSAALPHERSSGCRSPSAHARACMAPPPAPPAAVVAVDHPPRARATLGSPPMAATVLRDAPSRRFVRFARRPVVTSSETTLKSHPVAATSCAISQRSDRWIGDFFAPSQSRFTGPTSSACISSTAAPFGVLPVLVRSWTLWLQWDLPILISCSGYRGE